MPKPPKYPRFREVVKELINDHYGTEVSESEMKVFESKLIEYAARGHYEIYFPYSDKDFKINSEDLLRFVRKPRAVVNFERLSLYTEVNGYFMDLYNEVHADITPDEFGNIPPFKEVDKTFRITTDLFRIKEKDLSFIKEVIDGGNLGLNVNKGEVKTEGNNSNLKKDTKPKTLFMDDEKNVLYFNNDNPINLRPEEIKLIEYMRYQKTFQLEQILTDHFNIKITGEQAKTISKDDRNIFDTYKSNINKKCQPLGIGDLIVKHGDIKKAFKLSRNIEKKTLNLKHS
jgi:hypothetical protein